VSSPNDAGYPGAGDPANGNGPKPGPSRSGPLSTTGPLAEPTDVPPWQRGPMGRSRPPQRRPPDSSAPPTTGIDNNRINRLMSGSAVSPKAPESDGPPRSEAYASELPDLSGPSPRPPAPRKPAPDRPVGEPPARPPASLSRVQVSSRPRGPVRASMQIRRVDPWSVLKVSLVLSIALFFVWMIAVAFLYLVLGGMGVWSKLNSNVGDLLTNTSNGELVSSGAIFGGAALIGLVNIVLLTAMATIGAFIYNLTTDLVGGVEVTLADRD
jgi:Transmembrane domain of unknown function (DUF3566)